MKKLFICGALIGALATIQPAQAHTNQIIVAGQILNGGYINLPGDLEPIQVDDGPASDGTMVWTNADESVTGLSVACESGDCLSLPPEAQAVLVTTPFGEQTEVSFTKGTWVVTTQGPETPAKGTFRVTGGH